MPLISGIHICEKCGKELFWEYHLPEFYTNGSAFTYTKGSLRPTLLNSRESKILEFFIECTECNQINDFTYDNRNYCNKLKWR